MSWEIADVSTAKASIFLLLVVNGKAYRIDTIIQLAFTRKVDITES